MMLQDRVSIVEVGPRDGFQPIAPMIPTATKIGLVKRLYDSGLRRIEATAFVSDKAIAQMSDAAQVLAAAQSLPELDVQVLAPNRRYAELALKAGARHIAYVLSVSESHNFSNVRRTSQESLAEYEALTKDLPGDVKVRLNLATAFDCPFEGAVPDDRTLDLLARLVAACPRAEVALCDTTGKATPDRVSSLFETAREFCPEVAAWVFHGHDTYGLGVANVLAAHSVGVRIFDASFGGLGGCPFAPGATGNVATEDVVWTLHRMGVETGIDLDRLLDAAVDGAALPGAAWGGRVRTALRGAQQVSSAA